MLMRAAPIIDGRRLSSTRDRRRTARLDATSMSLAMGRGSAGCAPLAADVMKSLGAIVRISKGTPPAQRTASAMRGVMPSGG
jgi:hypothetical protein